MVKKSFKLKRIEKYLQHGHALRNEKIVRFWNFVYGSLTANYWRNMGTVPQCRLRGSSETVPVCFGSRIALCVFYTIDFSLFSR